MKKGLKNNDRALGLGGEGIVYLVKMSSIAYSWLRRFSAVKMSSLSKSWYRVSVFIFEIPVALF